MREPPEIESTVGGATVAASPIVSVMAAPWRLLALAALIAVSVGAVAFLAPMLGMYAPPQVLAVVGVGALVVHLVPARAFEITAFAGLVSLALANASYAIFHLALVAALFVTRRRTWALAGVLVALAIWLPKYLFFSHYDHPAVYAWINESSLVLVLFVTASWWRSRRDGRLPAAAERASPAAWAVPFLLPGHVLNPLVFPPGDFFRLRGFDPRGVLSSLALVVVKALAHVSIGRFFAHASYGLLDGAKMANASRIELWEVVAVGYVDLVIILSGTADVAVLLARLYGWRMPPPFRFALLAWNPAELWRRWGIYNRKILLSLVYFPLGGGRRHRYRNVMLTFATSALLLHTGWFGSKYWLVGPAGWRDQTVYFLIQGVLVCAALFVRDLVRPGVDARRPAADDHALRWSWRRIPGTVATQAASALAHVVILAQALPFGDRFDVIARCLGAI